MKKSLIALFVFCLLGFAGVCQQKGEKIELKQAGELEGGVHNGMPVRKLRHEVILTQKGLIMYCDSAYQYRGKNDIELFGHVKILQGDTFTLTGDKLYYDGDLKQATVTGNVTMKEPAYTLTTNNLFYDMRAKIGHYRNGGKIVDEENTLTSEFGHYFANEKLFTFRKNVKLHNEEFDLESDTMHYHSDTKIAKFKGPTNIITPDGVIETDKGEYDTRNRISNLSGGGSSVETEEYRITGKILRYNPMVKYGYAEKDVVMVSKKDNLTIEGDIGHYWGNQGHAKVYGKNTLLTSIIEPGDTMFLLADTMISIRDTINNIKKLWAYHSVRVFKNDLQVKCDSLIYDLTDSVIYIFNDPVLWSDGNQMTADTVRIYMKEGKLDQIYLRQKAYIISTDSLKNFNQVKGKNMLAQFREGKLNSVDVDGNGENIYFALEEGDSVLTGMNKVVCSDIKIRFTLGKLHTINYIKKPDALFIPPHELQEPDTRLKGFKWRSKERPLRDEFFRAQSPVSKSLPVPTPQLPLISDIPEDTLANTSNKIQEINANQPVDSETIEPVTDLGETKSEKKEERKRKKNRRER